MHPTRTTTTLLLGVACAVSAVSGCVHVNPAAVRPAVAPAAGVPPQHETRSGRGAAPVEVQAPALEALRTAPDPVAEDAAAPAAPAPRADAPPAGSAPQGTAPAHVELPPPVLDIPEPPAPAGSAPGRSEGKGESEADRKRNRREARKVERELMKRLPVRPSDVCALGRKHGSWQPDSPEARICAGVHDG
ncbi:hypothetical protein [Streptomyces sp. NPDC002054]|uniref:hypothetical protein n=1 Tax=Streptomyces sp. NPDC002054 TaxID=3154663 RepID=UPI0033244D26